MSTPPPKTPAALETANMYTEAAQGSPCVGWVSLGYGGVGWGGGFRVGWVGFDNCV